MESLAKNHGFAHTRVDNDQVTYIHDCAQRKSRMRDPKSKIRG